ncbi:amino acid ABC transporter permease [Propioniferax innocua]|uniref:Amino acid ABC transporter membrane protein 2 (PAAT family) n=1 Tax=Propioniferax innocua TaxID=1753 RepID=A0A542ZR61_9ACTN|nr:amino acid ABC transporter permease [Propioniferax innocua]TQL62776.1 amino acid ABC transporter membrane protein 2 (PAAT family) [Propioniferax innocua]
MSAQPTVLFDAPGPRGRRNILLLNIVGVLLVVGLIVKVLVDLAQKGQLAGHLWINAINGAAWQDYLLPGLQFTLQAAAISVATSLVFGLAFGFLRLAPFAVIRWGASIIVEFLRAVPVLVMMVFLYTALAQVSRTTGAIAAEDSPYYAVIIGLTLYNGSVIAELIRSGVNGLPKGQREAASAIGMTRNQSLLLVEVPQAITAMMPSLLSQIVIIIKDSALGYLIGFYELLQYSRQLGSGQGNMLQALVVAALVFIVLNTVLTLVARWLAGRLSSRTSGATALKPGPAGSSAPHL